jgi:hypothetical protein
MGTEIGEFRLGHPIRILLRVFLLELLVFQRASVRRRRRFHASDLLKRGGQPRGLGRDRKQAIDQNRQRRVVSASEIDRRRRSREGRERREGGVSGSSGFDVSSLLLL